MIWNCCLNPFCPLFGEPASGETPGTPMITFSSLDGGAIRMCRRCRSKSVVKNTAGILAEIKRLKALRRAPPIYCEKCDDPDITFDSNPEMFTRNGNRVIAGQRIPRYICRCGKTLNPPGRPKLGIQKRDVNARIFDDTFNHVAINRIGGSREPITLSLIVSRQKAFFEQFKLWSQYVETSLLKGVRQRRGDKAFLLSTDAQEYSLNWRNSRNPNEIIIQAITTCDTHSGYVFASDCNHDPSISIQEKARLAKSFRPEMSPDAQERAQLIIQKRKLDKGFMLRPEIRQSDSEISAEDRERQESEKKTVVQGEEPKGWPGSRVFVDYTAAAHFQTLSDLLPNVDEMHFLLDGDPFLRPAALAGLRERIQEKRTQVFLHHYDKETTEKQKQSMARFKKISLEKEMADRKITDPQEMVRVLIRERLERLAKWPAHQYELENAAARIIPVPRPHVREPEKHVRCLTTDFADPAIRESLVWVIARASMTYLDAYFGTIRKDLQLVDRPQVNATLKNEGANFIYCASSPQRVYEMTQIYRIYYNFCRVPRGAKRFITPAMRLGLVDRILDPLEILEANPVLDMMRAAKS